jgi:hypothetical protein
MLFYELLHTLAMHESADHVVVHPQMRLAINGLDEVIEALMSEELSIWDANSAAAS